MRHPSLRLNNGFLSLTPSAQLSGGGRSLQRGKLHIGGTVYRGMRVQVIQQQLLPFDRRIRTTAGTDGVVIRRTFQRHSVVYGT